MPVEHISIVLDYDGSNLKHVVAYGYERYGDDEQVFAIGGDDVGPFDTDMDLGLFIARCIRRAHAARLR